MTLEDVFRRRVEYLDRNSCLEAIQERNEMFRAWCELYYIRPNVFVEIGTLFGGSLYTYAGACAVGAKIISVDVPRRDSYSVLSIVLHDLKVDGFDVTYIGSDSHKQSTLDEVTSACSGSIDALHIDGGHKYHLVKDDYGKYEPLVRDGGIVILHDVAAAGPGGVVKLWNELKCSGVKYMELSIGPVVGHDHRSGIGLIWKQSQTCV